MSNPDQSNNFFDKFTKEQSKNNRIVLILAILAVLVFLTITVVFPFKNSLFSQLYPKSSSQASTTNAVRGQAGDLWADVIIGKPDFSEVVPGTVVSHKLFLPHGVIVDRSVNPNRMYVYDAGNNRILGFDLGKCLTNTTNPLNCSADIVLGQPSTSTAACNGDSAFQNYPNRASASASTICGEAESVNSITEAGSGSSMAVDSQGNLYVNDGSNNRVLEYYSPFTTDTVADQVWGQTDFTGNTCNKGQILPDATTICYNWGNSNNWTAGVDVDASGNVWIVDNGNNRILRFPPNTKTADLVLGQSSFTSNTAGNGLNQLNAPAAARIGPDGRLYVSDQGNNRVLVYTAPFSNGMNAITLGGTFSIPSGIDFDPTQSGVWVTEMGMNLVKLVNTSTGAVISQIGVQGNGNVLGDATGSVGIDSKGDIFIAEGKGDHDNDVVMYAKGASTDLPTNTLFGGGNNQVDAYGLSSGAGVAVSDNQLIVADKGRILFWNNPLNLTSGKPADGVTGEGGINNFNTIHGINYNITTDKNHHLYVASPQDAAYPDRIDIYQLPLTIGALPIKSIIFPLNVLGGGQVNETGQYQSFTGVAVAPDGSFLWVSHESTNRVFRIRNPLVNPLVDVVLGQTDLTGTLCNQGTPAVSGATSSTLCQPGGLALDRYGNLYISDHGLEIQGNMRLLEFNASLFPANNTSVIYASSASKIFPNIATWQPAFDSQNHMVVGYNPYWTANPGGGWFSGVYLNPLSTTSTTPDSLLKDYHSMAFSATFDDYNNLYVGDLNRSRVLIYENPFNDPTPTPSPSPTSTPTPTVTPTPTPKPTLTPTPTPALDTQAPTVPTNLTAATVSSTQITLSWTASTDNVGVVGYQVFRNDTLITTVSNTTFGDSTLSPSTTYSYYVKAYDAAGNISTASNTASATTANPPAITGTIQGTVTSLATNSPIVGATIYVVVNHFKQYYSTDSFGYYQITNLPFNSYSIKYSASGYSNKTVSVTLTSSSPTVTENVALSPNNGKKH